MMGPPSSVMKSRHPVGGSGRALNIYCASGWRYAFEIESARAYLQGLEATTSRGVVGETLRTDNVDIKGDLLMQVQESRPKVESVAATGNQVFETVKKLIHEGNVRRITIKQDGDTIAEFPLTFGVVGAALAPLLAAIGAIAALVNDCTIEIERDDDLPQRAGT
jgi:hypothetical protein